MFIEGPIAKSIGRASEGWHPCHDGQNLRADMGPSLRRGDSMQKPS